jgi:hypothetical protein
MVTGILTLVPPAGTGARADIKNARVGRERLDTLIAALKAQREDARAAFLRTVATDLAGLKGAPTRTFTETEFAKFTTAHNTDKDLENRITAFESLAPLLDEYIEHLIEKNHTELVALLAEERAALESQLEKEDDDKALVESRIEAIDADLAKWSTPSQKSAKTPRAKSTAKKAGARKPGRK